MSQDNNIFHLFLLYKWKIYIKGFFYSFCVCCFRDKPYVCTYHIEVPLLAKCYISIAALYDCHKCQEKLIFVLSFLFFKYFYFYTISFWLYPCACIRFLVLFMPATWLICLLSFSTCIKILFYYLDTFHRLA